MPTDHEYARMTRSEILEQAVKFERLADSANKDAHDWRLMAEQSAKKISQMAEDHAKQLLVEQDRDYWRFRARENADRLMRIQDTITAAIHEYEGDDEFDGTPESAVGYFIELSKKTPDIEVRHDIAWKVVRIKGWDSKQFENRTEGELQNCLNAHSQEGWKVQQIDFISSNEDEYSVVITFYRNDGKGP